ncbi:hypothetical protein [Enterococcus ratti]|uniref:Uncharacterized protein n=1 Tax=Enterococcus ratti TaxID=150033 RepID=A0A1L8WHL2_9ENTE|nr:hypothetical protein [Enterococcus ratti]OJG80513.1 hypothetical protein RV14_GL000575 [Enterococcus ratti]
MSFWGFEQESDEIVLMYINCHVRCLREAARLEMKKRKLKNTSIKYQKNNKKRRNSNG